MVDFHKVFNDDNVENPFSAKKEEGWSTGFTPVYFLQNNYGECNSVDEMIDKTDSEGRKKFFQHYRAEIENELTK